MNDIAISSSLSGSPLISAHGARIWDLKNPPLDYNFKRFKSLLKQTLYLE